MDRVVKHLINADGETDQNLLEQLAFYEKMAELGKLAAGIVHELNTPLSVIASAAQIILREEELSEFVKEMVTRIGDEAQRLARFSRGVLSFARTEEDSYGEADINAIIKEVLLFLHYEAQKRSITVLEELDFHLPALPLNPNYLKQILINLIINAMQSMPDGGTLLLRTYADSHRQVTIQVADTGCGIAADKLSQIFEPFFSTKKAGEGTGLGLYVTSQLVNLLKGQINVASAAGKGTTFTVDLPLSI